MKKNIIFLLLIWHYTSHGFSPLAFHATRVVLGSIGMQKKTSIVHTVKDLTAAQINEQKENINNAITLILPSKDTEIFPFDTIGNDEYWIYAALHTKQKNPIQELQGNQYSSDDLNITKTITREEALQEIEKCTRRFISYEDTRSAREHVEDLEELAQYLDPEADKLTLILINKFTKQKNVSGWGSTISWARMLTDISNNLHEGAPVAPELWEKSYRELIARISHRCSC